MRLLQLMMIVLLTGCMVWASAIFLGPWAMTKYLERYASHAVKVSGLKVTPKLAVTASSMDIIVADLSVASLRGVKFDWTILSSDGASVTLTAPLGKIYGRVGLGGINLSARYSGHGRPLEILGSAKRVEDEVIGFADEIGFKADTDLNLEIFDSVEMTMQTVESFNPNAIRASGVELEIEALDLGANISSQKMDGTVQALEFDSEIGDIAGRALQVKFSSAAGIVMLDYQASVVSSEARGMSIASVKGSATYDAVQGLIGGPVELNLEDFAWGKARLPNVTSEITLSGRDVSISAEGSLSETEILIDGSYVGSTPDMLFTVDLDGQALESSTAFFGDVELSGEGREISLIAKVKGHADTPYLLNCAATGCDVRNLTADYTLATKDARINGNSTCTSKACWAGEVAHTLQIDDTSKFFENMQALKLMSPLALGLVYAQFLRGVPVGRGHRLKF